MFVSVKMTLKKKIETLQTNTVIMLIRLFKTFYATVMNIKKSMLFVITNIIDFL